MFFINKLKTLSKLLLKVFTGTAALCCYKYPLLLWCRDIADVFDYTFSPLMQNNLLFSLRVGQPMYVQFVWNVKFWNYFYIFRLVIYVNWCTKLVKSGHAFDWLPSSTLHNHVYDSYQYLNEAMGNWRGEWTAPRCTYNGYLVVIYKHPKTNSHLLPHSYLLISLLSSICCKCHLCNS